MTDSPHPAQPDPFAPDPFAPDPFAFVPIASATNRHDGWTPDRQRGFIAALSQIGVVSAAAKSVGLSAKSAYALRRRAGPDSGFTRAWDLALGEGQSRSLDIAIDRATSGTAVPVFYRGRQVGQWQRYDNRLLFAALRAIAARTGDRATRAAPAPTPDAD